MGRSATARKRRERLAQAVEAAAEALGPHAMASSSSERADSEAAVDMEEYELIPLDDESEEGEGERVAEGEGEATAVQPAPAVQDEVQSEVLGETRVEEEAGAEADATAPTGDEEGAQAAVNGEAQERVAQQLTTDLERQEEVTEAVASDSLKEQSGTVGVSDREPAASSDNSSPKNGDHTKVDTEEPIELSLVMSDSSVEAAVETTQELAKRSVEHTPATSEAEMDSATPSNDSGSAPTLSAAQRKRKRTKKMFSSRKYQSHPRVVNGEVVKPVPAPISTEHVVEHVHGKQRHVEHVPDYTTPSPKSESTFLYPSTPPADAWQWESCEAYFAPLSQDNIEDLERIRRSQANFVAANAHSPFSLKLDGALLDAMLIDATDKVGAHVDLDQRRGRYYRDVWEEEDFIAAERRKNIYRDDTDEMAPSVVYSNHDLVFGYDDDCYRDYVMRLEKALAKSIATETKKEESEQSQLEKTLSDSKSTRANGRRPPSPGSSSKRNRSKKPPRPSARSTPTAVLDSPLESILPQCSNVNIHPASLGRWKLVKEKEVDYTAVHPASCNRNGQPVRWLEEVEAHQESLHAQDSASTEVAVACGNGFDKATPASAALGEPTIDSSIVDHTDKLFLRSFGSAGLEQDEISHAIAASMSKLMPLSMVNWRTLQTVYERAACAQQCSSIFEAEAAASKALEQLYLSKFCAPLERGDPNSLPPTPSAQPVITMTSRERQPVSLQTRPRDLITFSSRPAFAGEDAVVPVAASVEFAMTLCKGDIADVLDRNGCWNEGVVLEVYAENGQYTKFVLVQLSLWSSEVAEWIGVTEGRLLPRGVSSGKMEFVLSRSQFRDKKLIINRSIAIALERSFPQRRAKLNEVGKKEAQLLSRLISHDDGPSQKRKRKR